MSAPVTKKSTGLSAKLLWLTAVVLVVPWLGLQSLDAMKTFLVEGQQQAQLLSVKGLATLLANRPELFAESAESAAGVAELPLFPSHGHKVVDGYDDDWQGLEQFALTFGETGKPPGFSLILAEEGAYVYGFIRVKDATPVSFHPGLPRMDSSDQLRFYLHDSNGEPLHVLVAFEGNGAATAYRMANSDKKWRSSSGAQRETAIRVQASVREQGYQMEFRMPLGWLGREKQFGLEVVDVADPVSRTIVGRATTSPGLLRGLFNPVIARSAEVENLLRQFSQDNTRLWLIDSQHRVRAIVGSLQAEDFAEGAPVEKSLPPPKAEPWWRQLFKRVTGLLVGVHGGSFTDFDATTVHTRNDTVYQQALAGELVASRRNSLDGKAEIIMAAAPVVLAESSAAGAAGVTKTGNVGVVLLEKSTANILQLQRQSLETLVGLTVLGMLLVSLVLLAFAFRLTLRIRHLGADAAANVDEFGRVVSEVALRGSTAGDEIGDLARVIGKVLARLSHHQAFLKNIPRTLRHEINNPLNTIATSLDRLEQRQDSEAYLQSARRGLARINHVVNSLAEAASLEQALQAEQLHLLNLAELLRVYIHHQSGRQGITISLDIPADKLMINGCDQHLEAMLDKLLDNARDFCDRDFCNIDRVAEPPIQVSVERRGKYLALRVCNAGEPIPEERLKELFDFMTSHRAAGAGDHLGLGLYVVKVIAEHHGGVVSAENLADGVCFTVTLPLAG